MFWHQYFFFGIQLTMKFQINRKQESTKGDFNCMGIRRRLLVCTHWGHHIVADYYMTYQETIKVIFTHPSILCPQNMIVWQHDDVLTNLTKLEIIVILGVILLSNSENRERLKISGILIVHWPITIKFRIRKQTVKPQTNYRCCLRF